MASPAPENPNPGGSRTAAPVFVLLVALFLTVLATVYMASSTKRQDELRFDSMASEARVNIHNRMNIYIGALHAAAGLFAARQARVEAPEFARFVARLRLEERFPGIQGLGFTARTEAAGKAALEARLRRENGVQHSIYPATPRAEYHCILFLEPHDRRNLRALGYDMYTEPVRRRAMDRARDSGRAASSGKVVLVQEIDDEKQAGFLIYIPVYRGGSQPSTVAERRRNLVGFVYSPFRAGDLLSNVLGYREKDLGYELYIDQDGTEALLHSSPGMETGPHKPPYYETIEPLNVAGTVWRLHFTTLPAFRSGSQQYLAGLTFILGLIISLVLFRISWLQASARAVAEGNAEQLRQSQARLRASEARARRLLESNLLGVVIINARATIVEANDAFLVMSGYDRTALHQGRMNWLAMSQVQGITDDPLGPTDADSAREWTLRRKDGSELPALIGAVSLDDTREPGARLVFVLDLTAARQAEAERRALEERFRLMADTAPVLIWMTDTTGRLTWINRRWLSYSGRPMGAELGEGWLNGVHPEDRMELQQVMRSSYARELPFTVEFRLLRYDGEYRWFLVSGVPLHFTGAEWNGYIGSGVDITERREVEEERQRLLDSERQAREEAERVSRLKDEFVATVSHELRTPLTAILGWSHLLRSGRLPEAEFTAGLATIERNARAQSALIDDLLDMSRMISGRMQLKMDHTDFRAVVERAVEGVSPAAAARQITVDTRLEPELPALVGDAERLQQVVNNLLSNALKFSPHHTTVQVTLSALRESGRPVALSLKVQDQGCEIKSSFLPHVFDPFRQADSSATRRHGGLGIGLSIVRQVVEMHHGQVEVHSPGENLGATFTVTLPLPSGERSELGYTSEANDAGDLPAGDTFRPLQGRRVLVVDDEADTRDLLRVILREAGANTATAGAAEDALEVLEDWCPDLLVLDVGLPGRDGYDLMREIRALPETKLARLPALALTAYATDEDRRKALEAGFDHHLSKPVDGETLVGLLSELTAAGPTTHGAGN